MITVYGDYIGKMHRSEKCANRGGRLSALIHKSEIERINPLRDRVCAVCMKKELEQQRRELRAMRERIIAKNEKLAQSLLGK